MKKIWGFLPVIVAALVAGCDLQPRIVSLPDSVGEFISDRYPALLADPVAQPEIYNSAATDYGVYASPELYGSVKTDDYILYSDINDYMLPTEAPVQTENAATTPEVEAPVRIVAQYQSPDQTPAQSESDAGADDYLVIPMYGGPADARTVTVVKGDTLYSIAHK